MATTEERLSEAEQWIDAQRDIIEKLVGAHVQMGSELARFMEAIKRRAESDNKRWKSFEFLLAACAEGEPNTTTKTHPLDSQDEER